MVKKKRSVYQSLLVSYICILLVPVIICAIFYFYCYRNIKEQTESSNRNLIETIQKSCDREFEYYQNMLLQMSYNQNAKQLASRRAYSSGEDYYQTYVFHNELADLNIAINRNNNYCIDNFVYLFNTDRVISSTGVYNYKEYISLIAPGQMEDQELLKEYLSQYHFCKLIGVEMKEGEKGLLFVTSIGEYFSDKTIAVAGMWLDIDCLDYWIESSSWEEGIEWFAINSEDEIIYGTNNIDVEVSSDTLLESKEIELKWNDTTYMAVVVESRVTDLIYILLMPKTVITGIAGKMTRMFFVSIVGCIFVGYVVSKLFAKKNYSPLKSLMEHFGDKEREKDTNEYDYLKEIMQQVFKERSDIEKSLKQNKENLKQLNLYKALTTSCEKNIVDNMFERGKNLVLLVSLFKDLQENEEQLHDAEGLKRFIVRNVFGEGLEAFYKLEIVDAGEELAFIINIEKNDIDYIEKIQEIIEELQKFILNNFRFSTCVFVGDAHAGIDGIHTSYIEACKAKEFQMILEEDYINYREISDITIKKYNYSFEMEERIINALRKGDAEVALLCINKVLDINFYEQKGTPELLSCLLYDILGTVMRTAEEVGKSAECILSMMKVSVPLSCTKIKKCFAEIIEYICKEDSEEKDEQKEAISNKIYEYILENYNDFDLNISRVGLHFDMTPSYLAKLFKKQTGESLLKTINEIRVNKAMEFLRQGNNVSETAEMCGFRESSNLIRIFKKYTGITPGQYGELNKSK